jgi:hypothetical protein
MKLDILVRIEGFHLRAGAETSPGTDRDDTQGTYRALRGQRGNEAVPLQQRSPARHRQTEVSAGLHLQPFGGRKVNGRCLRIPSVPG